MPDLDRAYAERQARQQQRRWKQVLDVQAPYRRLVRRLAVGSVLEVGCGVGRNLRHLEGRAVGVDTNAESVRLARAAGLPAYEPEDFHRAAATLGPFDTLLASHVLEHIGATATPGVLADYLALLRPTARLVFVTPQEAGYRKDPTHVELLGFDALTTLVERLGFQVSATRSFPFPRALGRVFPYNEFVVVGDRSG